MADETGSETQSEQGSGDNSGAASQQTGQNADQSSASGDKKTEASAQVVTREEYDAVMRRMQAADKRASDEAAARKQLEDKGKDELTRSQERVKELEQSVQQSEAQLQKLRLQNAFLSDVSHSWHDPSDVLRFVMDDDLVTIDDNGNVQGMKAALDKLAKGKPYLVKPKDESAAGAAGKSGADMNSGSGGNKEPDTAALRNKYPALRR